MNWLGDYPEDFSTVSVYFTTHDSNGAPIAPLTAFEADDVKIYKNGDAAQKTTTNGLTMTSPFDSITGLHRLLIDTSNDTGDSGFWTAGGGGVYTVVLNPDTETVNGQTVLKVIGTFGICLSPALRPTAAGRTLDVTATGAAGVDWGNVENLTTVNALSGTTIATVTNQLTAAQIATGVWQDITAGDFTLANSIGKSVMNGVALGTGLTVNDITTKSGFSLSSTQSFNLTGDITGNLSGSIGSVTGLTASDVGSIKTKTDFLPSATAGSAGGVFIAGTNAATTVTTSFTTTFTGNLTGNVGGNVTGSVGSVSGNVGGNVSGTIGGLTAAALKDFFDTDSTTTYASAVAGSVVKEIVDNAGGLTAAAIADAVWEEAIADHDGTAGSTAEALSAAASGGSAPTASEIADEVQTRTIAAVTIVNGLAADTVTAAAIASDAGTEIGTAVWATATRVLTANTNLNDLSAAGVRSAVGLASANLDTQIAAVQSDTDDIQTRLPISLVSGRMDASVGAMANGVLTATAIAADAITDAKVAPDVTIASVTGSVGSVTGSVGSVTGLTASNLDVTVSSRLASASYTAPPSAATIASAVWDALTSALTTVGTIGKLLVTNIDATISSRSSYAGGDTSGTTTLLSRLTSTRAGLLDNLDATISSRLATSGYTAPLSAAGTRSAVGLASANLDTQLDALPTNAELATALGTADDATLAAIAALSIPTANQNADALLDRADAIETGLTPRQAMRLSAASDAGKLSGGATTTNTIRNAVADDKDRIIATVDADGNRTAITYDLT